MSVPVQFLPEVMISSLVWPTQGLKCFGRSRQLAEAIWPLTEDLAGVRDTNSELPSLSQNKFDADQHFSWDNHEIGPVIMSSNIHLKNPNYTTCITLEDSVTYTFMVNFLDELQQLLVLKS